jgi:hypothetical protein
MAKAKFIQSARILTHPPYLAHYHHRSAARTAYASHHITKIHNNLLKLQQSTNKQQNDAKSFRKIDETRRR